MKDKIFVVTHKKIEKIIKKDNYSYIQVNNCKNGNMGFEFNDAILDNISCKNANYCELTALYWIWKNYECDKNTVLGISHYRRFFLSNNLKNKFNILGVKKAKKILDKYDIILPKKFIFPMSTYAYYYKNGSGKKKDLDNTKKIIRNKYPEYADSVNWYFSQNSGHYCNMIICKKEIFDDYCKWLFSILFELEKITDLSNYTQTEARIYGYISELLLNVYVHKNGLKVKELSIINTEDTLMFKIKRKISKLFREQ